MKYAHLGKAGFAGIVFFLFLSGADKSMLLFLLLMPLFYIGKSWYTYLARN